MIGPRCVVVVVVVVFISFVVVGSSASDPWSNWWSYDWSLSGPNYWGVLNSDWSMCKDGRQQSPIDIKPSQLLYDPNLKHLKMDFASVKGLLENTGRDITLRLQYVGYDRINMSIGPLSYNYTVKEIKFHFGASDTNGSEHRIAGISFPVEMQIIAFNSDLYTNISEAVRGNKGVAIVAVFMEVGKEDNKAFRLITKELKGLDITGRKSMVHHLALDKLLPVTDHYMTYDGSLTQPGCQETVTWIILNKPIYISRTQLSSLRVMYPGRGDLTHNSVHEANVRPLMPLNHRVVRTNINFRKRSRICSMERDTFYQVNDIYKK